MIKLHMIAATLVLFFASIGTAARAGDIVNFYNTSIRESIKQEYEKALQQVEIEIKRKAAANKPAPSRQTLEDAMNGLKFAFYNKAVRTALCTEEATNKAAATTRSTEVALKEAYECIMRHGKGYIKFSKLSENYGALGKQEAICEIKYRDYDNEIRFPPYDFLTGTMSMALFDFDALNKCILSTL